jgi:hypothetical protein
MHISFLFYVTDGQISSDKEEFCDEAILMAAGLIRASSHDCLCGGGVAPKPRHCHWRRCAPPGGQSFL